MLRVVPDLSQKGGGRRGWFGLIANTFDTDRELIRLDSTRIGLVDLSHRSIVVAAVEGGAEGWMTEG